MSNEELAKLIYNSTDGKNALLSELYNKLIKFTYKVINGYYVRFSERFSQLGIEPQDLLSNSYFAMIETIEKYCKKDTEYKFITFYAYHLKTHILDALGFRTKKSRYEPLNNCKSIDAPISDNDDCTLADIIKDSEIMDEAVVEDLTYKSVFPAVKKIIDDDIYYNVIEQIFKYNKTLQEIAQEQNTTRDKINQLQNKALAKLRKPNPELNDLKESIIGSAYRKSGLGYYKSTGTSSTEWAALKLISSNKIKKGD